MKQVISLFLMLSVSFLFAQEEVPTEALNGTYHLLFPERDVENKTKRIQFGENNGTKLLAIAACEKCMPAIYSYQESDSKQLGVPVFFNSTGLYVIAYDKDSFINVLVTNKLGDKEWKQFAFSNFYSKNKAVVNTMTKAKIEAYAVQLSKRIQEPTTNSGSLKEGDGKYAVASPVRFAGKYYNELTISFEEGAVKKIVTELCNDCGGSETYVYMDEYSKLIGVEVYTNKRTHLEEYVFVEKPGVLLWLKYKGSGLGGQLFGAHDYYNMFAIDKQVTRALANSESQQKELDDKIAEWSKIIKDAEDKKRIEKERNKIENERLPKQGLANKTLEAQALVTAKNWAFNYKWKETITKTYFTSSDWTIVRNKLTGIQIGREIRGVIVMARPDGLCSYHHCIFGQEYDGSNYLKVYTVGITPGQIKLNCKNVK